MRRPHRNINDSHDSPSVYGTTFWLCYAANSSLMVAVSVLFRYSDFVSHIGGGPKDLGLIVGVGMIGALLMRAAQGVGIDRYGPRLIWLLSLALFTISALAHLPISRADGAAVYVVRILFTTSTAGAFGASLTYISLRAPAQRMGEMLGTLGTSGFIGLALGPVCGDYLFHDGGTTATNVQRMFLLAAGMGGVSLIFTIFATRTPARREMKKRPPLIAVVRRYHPGMILPVAAAMGFAVGLPHTFLRAYAAELELDQIKVYFLVYACVAFSVRVATRRLSDQIGVRPLIVWGLFSAAVSMWLYLLVHNQWTLAIPAVAAGVAHAFLFPAVMSGGNATFPARYRGIATTLSLAMFDAGNLIGQPAVGAIIEAAKRAGLPAYPTMFASASVVLVVVASVYAWRTRSRSMAGESERNVQSLRKNEEWTNADEPVPPADAVVLEPIVCKESP